MLKRIIIITAMLLSMLFASPASSQVFIRERPIPPPAVTMRPVCPGSAYIWIEPEWRWNRRMHRYMWREGYWIRPHRHQIWIQGHWIDSPRGSAWIPGHWGR